MRLLANMNISPLTVKTLRDLGWDVLRVSDVLPTTASDEVVLNRARHEGRVLISQDLDFSKLLALGGHSSPSLITVRMIRSDPESVTRRLRQILPELSNLSEEGRATTVDETSARLRQLPI